MRSGIPRALEEWPQIDLVSEVTGNQFTARVQRPAPQWQAKGEQVTEQVEAPVALTDTDKKILTALVPQPLSRSLLLHALGYTQPTGNYKAAMSKLLHARLIEPTIPDKPNSRLQQYRLTALGRQWLQESEQGKRHE